MRNSLRKPCKVNYRKGIGLMNRSQVEEAARILHAAWYEKTTISELPESCKPTSLDEGYEIQSVLKDMHGTEVAGYKIGATNRVAQEMFNVDAPFFGRVMAPSIMRSPANIPEGAVILYIIEAEFDFIFSEDLVPREECYTQDEVMEKVGDLIPAIEIPDSRYANWRQAGMPQLIADNAIASLLVLGEPASDWRTLDLSLQKVDVLVNDTLVDVGIGSNVLGDPRKALVWLANEFSKRSIVLKAGQLVTTGSAADVIKVKSGDNVVADFGILGSAEINLA